MNLHNLLMILGGLQAYTNDAALKDCKDDQVGFDYGQLEADRVWFEREMLRMLQVFAKKMFESVPFEERSHCVYMLVDFYFDCTHAIRDGKVNYVQDMIDQFVVIANKIFEDGFKDDDEVKVLKKSLTREEGKKLLQQYSEIKKVFTFRFFSRMFKAKSFCQLYTVLMSKNIKAYFLNMEQFYEAFRG